MTKRDVNRTHNLAYKTPPLIPRSQLGWIEIVEAFVAILLVAGVVLIILNKSSMSNADISQQVYTTELSMLREIETNDTFRAEIVAISNLPSDIPLNIQELINKRSPNYLTCTGKLCAADDKGCSYSGSQKKDIYAQSVLISSTLRVVEYRQLKIFCWTRNQADKCPDGTLYDQCSTTKPKYCNNGNLVDNCNECLCPTEQACNLISGACYSAQFCSDGTVYNTCSTTKPKYCNNGNLVDNCNICGCPTGQQCKISSSWFGTSESCQQIPTCSDGTLYNTCSTATIGDYCDGNGNLITKCSTCGCPTGQQCATSSGASVTSEICQ